ncbi:MAG: dihydroxyacetone kinase subunit DhaL [Roseinatronobacter sp.]
MLQVVQFPRMDMIDAAFLTDVFHRASARLDAQRAYLCELDGAIGDGDHGSSMAGGFAAIGRALRERKPASPADALRCAAQAFLTETGATVGPLYASAFLEAARQLDASPPLPMTETGVLLAACADGLRARGKAAPGDKTMLDVWWPAAQAATRAHREGAALARMADVIEATARAACRETAALISVRGRAARLQERSIGHVDPGAASSVEIIAAICDTLRDARS